MKELAEILVEEPEKYKNSAEKVFYPRVCPFLLPEVRHLQNISKIPAISAETILTESLHLFLMKSPGF